MTIEDDVRRVVEWAARQPDGAAGVHGQHVATAMPVEVIDAAVRVLEEIGA